MYVGRKCLSCGNTRIPGERRAVEKKIEYIIYTCPICKMQDLERIKDLPKSKLFNGHTFEDGPGTLYYTDNPFGPV
jgi:hypothetical protein